MSARTRRMLAYGLGISCACGGAAAVVFWIEAIVHFATLTP